MKDYCTCDPRRIDRAFLSAGLVYCSNCDKPVCCDAVDLHPGLEPHAAEIASEEHFTCWKHRESVANLDVRHSEPVELIR